MIPPDMVELLDDTENPQLFALLVKGGIFLCTSEGIVQRAEQTF